MCLVIVTRCLICLRTIQCNVVPCRKVAIAHQTCGERHQGPDNISDVMCDRCYEKTQPEIPDPSLKDKAKYYVKKFSPGGGSSSQVRNGQPSYTVMPVPLLDDHIVKELSEIANKKRRGLKSPVSNREVNLVLCRNGDWLCRGGTESCLQYPFIFDKLQDELDKWEWRQLPLLTAPEATG
ncbi:hypothetical protein V8C35DRAFT_301802 [Trichoderma chlorosporum]